MRYSRARMLGACALAASALSIDPAASAQGTDTTDGISCRIDYTINAQFVSGFLASITINNTGTTPISGWTLTWSFPDGQTIGVLFNGVATQTGANVSVQNRSYDGNIPAGGRIFGLVGFEGTWNNITNSIPTSFALNGTVCD
jgi:hypothetical protein